MTPDPKAAPSFLIPANDMGLPALPAQCQQILTAHGVTTSAALALFQQVKFQNGLLATLPEDQAAAAGHAQTFLDGWDAGVANGMFEGLQSIADEVGGLLSDALLPLAKRLDAAALTLDAPDQAYDTLLAEFSEGLTALQDAATTLDTGSTLAGMQALVDEVQSLSDLVADDATKITEAVQEVNEQHEIQDLAAKLGSLQQQLAGVNGTIAGGASDKILSSIVFGLQFGFGLLKPLESGVTAGAIAGGVLGIAGEAQSIAAYNKDIAAEYSTQASLIQQIDDLASQIAADEIDLLTLSLTAAQIVLFNDQLKKIHDAAQGLIDAMTGWSNQIGMLEAPPWPPPAQYFTTQVSDAQASWSALMETLDRCLGIIAASTSTATAAPAPAMVRQAGVANR